MIAHLALTDEVIQLSLNLFLITLCIVDLAVIVRHLKRIFGGG